MCALLHSIDRRTWKHATRWFRMDNPSSYHTPLPCKFFKDGPCINSNQDATAKSLAPPALAVKNRGATPPAPLATRAAQTISENMHLSSSPAFSDSASGCSAVRRPTQGLIHPCSLRCGYREASDGSNCQPLAPTPEMPRWDCWSISETGLDRNLFVSTPTPLCRCYPFFLAGDSEDPVL